MFDYFISLGWFCGMAGSLAKHGFRSGAGPFDWYESDLKGVLHFMDTDFSDFLSRENLEEDLHNPFVYHDTKYNLVLNHDINKDFRTEYLDIYKKYMRRVENYRVKIKSPTCFLRTVKDEEELKYIENHQDDIKRVITKENNRNEIVFLIPQWLKMEQKIVFPSFYLNIDRFHGESREGVRGMLDNNEDIIRYLQENAAMPKVNENLIRDREAECERKDENIKRWKHRYNIVLRLLNDELNCSLLPSHIVIYGAGTLGKAFYNKIKDICNVECFVDLYSDEGEYDGIPILSWDRINKVSCENFIITQGYNMDNIKACLLAHYPKMNVISVDTLLEK